MSSLRETRSFANVGAVIPLWASKGLEIPLGKNCLGVRWWRRNETKRSVCNLENVKTSTNPRRVERYETSLSFLIFFFYHCIKGIDPMLPSISWVNRSESLQNMVKTSVTHSPSARVPLFCSYRVLTSFWPYNVPFLFPFRGILLRWRWICEHQLQEMSKRFICCPR